MSFQIKQAAVFGALMAISLTMGCANSIDGIGAGALRLAQTVQQPGGGNNGAGAQPTPTPPAGQPNAKVFFKSPVAAANSTVGYQISCPSTCTTNPTTQKNYDQYLSDVTITGTQGGYLQNNDIRVLIDIHSETNLDDLAFQNSGKKRGQADANGNWFFSSINDSDFKLSQLMAYYWINKERDTVNNLIPNGWHPANRSVGVYSRCYDANGNYSQQTGLGLNAFWSGVGTKIVCMSFVGPLETAFDASVYLHEMGHANVDFGTNGQITTCSNGTGCGYSTGRCTSADGCGAAINEGQADVHSYFIFDSPVVAEFFMNDTQGFRDRNGNLMANVTAQTAFAQSSEIHHMGGVYGAIWWSLKVAIGLEAASKIFFAHLELLTANDSFRTAKTVAHTAANQLAGSGKISQNFSAEIDAAFSKHGIN